MAPARCSCRTGNGRGSTPSGAPPMSRFGPRLASEDPSASEVVTRTRRRGTTVGFTVPLRLHDGTALDYLSPSRAGRTPSMPPSTGPTGPIEPTTCRPELIFIIVTASRAALVGLRCLAALRSGASRSAQGEHDLLRTGRPRPPECAPRRRSGSSTGRRGSYARSHPVVDIIAGVLIGVGVSDAYESQAADLCIGGSVGAVVLGLHVPGSCRTASDRRPAWRSNAAGRWPGQLPAVLTGYGTSPFVFGFDLVAVAVALGLVVASPSWSPRWRRCPTLACWARSDPPQYGTGDLLRFGLTSARSGCSPTWRASMPPPSVACEPGPRAVPDRSADRPLQPRRISSRRSSRRSSERAAAAAASAC